jgi:predicted membrane protein
VFGGAEYDLSQADITETATLEINQVFGGTKLIVPSSWEIKSELVAVFGGIDDKRPIMSPNSLSSNKILILKGTTYFGGIDIRSYS